MQQCTPQSRGLSQDSSQGFPVSKTVSEAQRAEDLPQGQDRRQGGQGPSWHGRVQVCRPQDSERAQGDPQLSWNGEEESVSFQQGIIISVGDEQVHNKVVGISQGGQGPE